MKKIVSYKQVYQDGVNLTQDGDVITKYELSVVCESDLEFREFIKRLSNHLEMFSNE